jgi:hypothetical protein
MSHAFTVQLDDEIASVLKKVEEEITGIGGSFKGDSEKGSFNGKSVLGPIRGEYCSVSGNEIRITITHKPFLVPYHVIESEIKKYFLL